MVRKCSTSEAEEEEEVPEYDDEPADASLVQKNTEQSEQDCPEFCSEPRFARFPWEKKCWTYKCQGCPAWQENCADILKGEMTHRLCDGWCGTWLLNNLRKRNRKMCQWVNCQGCEEMVRKCSKSEAEEEEEVPEYDDEPADASLVQKNTEQSKQDCPEFCSEPRFARFPWEKKCWTYKCQGCPAWQENCADILKG